MMILEATELIITTFAKPSTNGMLHCSYYIVGSHPLIANYYATSYQTMAMMIVAPSYLTDYIIWAHTYYMQTDVTHMFYFAPAD